MSDLKTVCKKCGGYVSFPREMRGEASTCPHCAEPIVLGSKTPAWIWGLCVGVLVSLCGLSLVAGLIWSKQKNAVASQGGNSSGADTTVPVNSSASASPSAGQRSEDDKAITALCREYYDLLNERSAEKIQDLMTEESRRNIPLPELKAILDDGGRYILHGVDQITYRTTSFGEAAIAQISRTYNGGPASGEARREMFCLKENGQWRLFRIQEWRLMITKEYAKSGFSTALHSRLDSLRKNDPFTSWGLNDTNMLEQIFTDMGETTEAFPWRVGFTLKRATMSDYRLKLNVAISNKTSRTWPSMRFDLVLKQSSRKIGETSAIVLKVGPNQEVESEDSIFFTADQLSGKEYQLDVFYFFQNEEIPFAQFTETIEKN